MTERKLVYYTIIGVTLIGLLFASTVFYFPSKNKESRDIKGIYVSLELNFTSFSNGFFLSTDAEIGKSFKNHSIIIVSFLQKGIYNVSIIDYTISIEYSDDTEDQFHAETTKVIFEETWLSVIGFFPGIPDLPIEKVNITGV